MVFNFKAIALAAGVATLSAAGASAATLDFTKSSVLSSATVVDASTITGALGSINWTLKALGGTLEIANGISATERADCLAGSGNALTCYNDGVGAGNDEVSQLKTYAQKLVLSFSKGVFLKGIHILDAYIGQTQPGEGALAVHTAGGATITQIFAQGTRATVPSGYAFKSLNDEQVTSITFSPIGVADDDDIDFALAGVDLRGDGNEPDPVPLPAGGLLLIGALAGLAATRRKA